MSLEQGTAASFDAECWRAHQEARRVCPEYDGRWFQGQLKSAGGRATAKQLLSSQAIQSGFVELVAAGRHDLTVEYLATRQEFQRLFEPAELAEARRRLGHLSAT